MPPKPLGDRPLTNAEKQRRHRLLERERRLLADAENEQLRTAIASAYAILCAGKPPHSAREANARRALRRAIEPHTQGDAP